MLVRGDAVVLADPLHELVGFGRLEERAGDVLTLDRPFAAEPGETYHVALRDKRGREWGPCLVASIDGNVVTLDADDRLAVEAQHGALGLILPDTAVQEPAHVTLLAGEDRLFDGLLVDARPIGSQHWEVTLVNDDQRVHALDETEVMPAPWTPPAMIAPVPDAPVVRGIYADVKRGTLGLELHASWQPASGADRYVAEVSYDEEAADEPEASSWTPAHDGAATRLIAAVAPQPLTLRVAAIGRMQGPWVYYVIDVVPDPLLPPDVVGAEALKEELRLTTRRMQEMYEKAIARMMEIVAGADEVAGAVAEEKSVAVRFRDAAAVAMMAMSTAIEETEDGLAAQAAIVAAVQAAVGDISGGGLWKMEVVAGTGDVTVRAVIMMRATLGDAWVEVGTIWEAGFDGGDPLKPFSRQLWMADKIMIVDANGNLRALFGPDGLTIENIRLGTLTFDQLQSTNNKLILRGAGADAYIEMLS